MYCRMYSNRFTARGIVVAEREWDWRFAAGDYRIWRQIQM
jgi:hypothetical protein